MTHDTTSQDNHPVSRIGQEVLRAIASIQFGSIEIIIHEGQVVQIECREKKSASLLRTTFASPNNALPHQPVRITSTRQLENKN
jgi:hypothetical protein